jgi:hypothetical protein
MGSLDNLLAMLIAAFISTSYISSFSNSITYIYNVSMKNIINETFTKHLGLMRKKMKPVLNENSKRILTSILKNAMVGKKVAEQEGVNNQYWGATITDVYPDVRNYGDDLCYVIVTNIPSSNKVRPQFDIDVDFELEYYD